jgi:hypothetical protein
MKKLSVIQYIVKNSSSFKCNQIKMEVDKLGSRIVVRSTSTNFHATDLISELQQFSMYLKVENNSVILVIF